MPSSRTHCCFFREITGSGEPTKQKWKLRRRQIYHNRGWRGKILERIVTENWRWSHLSDFAEWMEEGLFKGEWLICEKFVTNRRVNALMYGRMQLRLNSSLSCHGKFSLFDIYTLGEKAANFPSYKFTDKNSHWQLISANTSPSAGRKKINDFRI